MGGTSTVEGGGSRLALSLGHGYGVRRGMAGGWLKELALWKMVAIVGQQKEAFMKLWNFAVVDAS